MSLRDAFQVNKIKAELEQVQKERDDLRTVLVETGRVELHEIPQAINKLQQEKLEAERALEEQKARAAKELTELQERAARDLASQRAKATQELDARIAALERQREELERLIAVLNQNLISKRAELVAVEDEVLLQSFGLYKPRYAFQNSDAYMAKLKEIRDRQAAMVKGGTATICPTAWTVNNSHQEGERMVRDYSKLVLRSFNNECEASIQDVKFSNVEAIEKRIQRAFDALNKLTDRMGISISHGYLNWKLQELHLCYEYQVKKQEEKEEQKRLREQLREEARVAREIEDMKLKLAKEEKHFSQALASVEQRLQVATTEAEREALVREKAAIEQNLAVIEKDKLDVQKREQNTRAGYVYVISNVGAFGENVYKIGVTRRLEPRERIDELGDSSVPFDFDIHALIFSDDAPALETALHRAFEKRKLNMINGRREFFNVTLDEIEAVVRNNFSKPVEFIQIPDAAEYRQSLKMRNGDVVRSFVVE